MDQELRNAKQNVREFLQKAYTDERLAMLLAHAQSGQLSYSSCCCVIGVTTATHALRGRYDDYQQPHYFEARNRFGANGGSFVDFGGSDERRRRVLIPMIRAEMRRRDRLRKVQTDVGQGPVQASPEETLCR
jgi:hypothetical protein